ncbi:MAG: hypothetical protein A3H94_03395 [Acidobacteria bacterium RIFCSPLOWO2_02_FULL_60_20]|nr:MAG: hypothetical protein A3H94_03395 [Acidobacteria bacterium RIFCSPLOWO2_02_FULL_60_20]
MNYEEFMKREQSHQLDVVGLKTLYENDVSSKRILECFARGPSGSDRISLDSLEKELRSMGSPVRRSNIVRVIKQLVGLGMGVFIVGRRGSPSRFLSEENLASIGQLAAEPSKENDGVQAGSGKNFNSKSKTAILRHPFHLRPDFEVGLDLPRDFNAREASRLAEFIKTLPFDQN